MKKVALAAMLALGSPAVADGVAQSATNDVSAVTNATWTIRRFEREMCGDDSWEPFNRAMFWIFDAGMEYVVDPFCYLYCSIVPKPLIEGIDNFCENLEYPSRLVSNLLMGEWTLAWDNTERFFINTTLGLGGLFDPAENWFDIYDDNASLSDTFSRWGIPAGPQLALPFMPRGSVRGHVGYVLDYAFDPKTWFDYIVPSGIFIGYSWSLTPNKAPIWIPTWSSVFYHTHDTYSTYMPMAAALNDFNLRQSVAHYCHDLRTGREVIERRPPVVASAERPEWLQGEWREIPGYAPRGTSLDSLRALCFSPVGDDDIWWERHGIFNGDFSKTIEEREIEIAGDLPEATYSFVAPKVSGFETQSRDRVVVVIPGLGSGRTASDAVAMAELLHEAGFAVVICDSVFTFEHMQSVNRGVLPGNIRQDVRRFADYLSLVFDDLREARRVRDAEISVIGWSMGGLVTLHLAAMDQRAELPLTVERFVAINPPTLSSSRSLNPISPQLAKSGEWTKDEAVSNGVQIAQGMFVWSLLEHPRFVSGVAYEDRFGKPLEYTPNISDEQANYMLCLTLRNTFVPLVAERHRKHPFPWLKSELTWAHRGDFYDELGDLTISEYLNRYLPTCYEGLSGGEMLRQSGVKSIAGEIRRSERVAVIHSWTDLLLHEGDREFYDSLLGSRITWFADGAHCGYFYTNQFRDELLRRLGGAAIGQ